MGVELKEPYTRHLGDKLRELRIEYDRNRYRIIHFFYIDQRIVLLNAFVKKTKKTPTGEIEIAKSRLNKFLEKEKQNAK
jgi:phage-related protein